MNIEATFWLMNDNLQIVVMCGQHFIHVASEIVGHFQKLLLRDQKIVVKPKMSREQFRRQFRRQFGIYRRQFDLAGTR